MNLCRLVPRFSPKPAAHPSTHTIQALWLLDVLALHLVRPNIAGYAVCGDKAHEAVQECFIEKNVPAAEFQLQYASSRNRQRGYQNTSTLSASTVQSASCARVPRWAPSMISSARSPRASMQVPHSKTSPLRAIFPSISCTRHKSIDQ